MSNGIMISFQDCQLEDSDPVPLLKLLDLVGFSAYLIDDPKGGAVNLGEPLGTSAEVTDAVLVEFLNKPSKLVFYEPHEYFTLTFFVDSSDRKCGFFWTDTRYQTARTMEKLASKGYSFLDFMVALQKLFSAASFVQEDTYSIDDYMQETADLTDRISLPMIAFGLPIGLSKAMLQSPEYQRWDTDIGEVCGFKAWGAAKS